MLKATVHRSRLHSEREKRLAIELIQTSLSNLNSALFPSKARRLTLKGEAGAELVARLVQLLGIERATNAEGQTTVDLGVVSEGRNAEVVDLGLQNLSERLHATQNVLLTLANEAGSILYLAASSRPTAP